MLDVIAWPSPNDYVSEAYVNEKGVWYYLEYEQGYGRVMQPCPRVLYWMYPPGPPL